MKTRFRTSSGQGSPRGREGVALVITLILLAVITFMAVTFLVLSRNQQGAVTSSTDQAIARLGADAAFERAKVQILAPMLGLNNPFNYDLTVSTDYHREGGFLSGVSSFTNVNYLYPNGTFLNGNDVFINLTNMLIDASPPVYMRRPDGTLELRTYLDLNQNHRYDTNGWLPELDALGRPVVTVSNNVAVTNYAYFTGDPVWIGGLEFPDRQHSSTNRFLYRYAWIALPISKTLDINYMHNYARMFLNDRGMRSDGFLRNQGPGTWDLNLAAFLVDLNTNLWPYPLGTVWGTPYFYNPNTAMANSGAAFDDAVGVLRYRYGQNWLSLLRPADMFGNLGATAFQNDFVDAYSGGPVVTNVQPFWNLDPDTPRLRFGWAGSYNTNHFVTTDELFDRSKTASGPFVPGLHLTDRLQIASTNVDSYDANTTYRLLSQLGTDSSPEPPKININYKNVDDAGNIVPAMTTNFLTWDDPVLFFTNAANHLLANAGYESRGPERVRMEHIQIYPRNDYTPTVHHLLQQAANLYDATTNRLLRTSRGPGFPTVFWPIFANTNIDGTNSVIISGYRELTDDSVLNLQPAAWHDLSDPAQRQFAPDERAMVYGIPLVIGAKKGYPNFNEFAMQTTLQITRKLEFRRAVLNGPVTETNQMYSLSISNTFGVEGWNSYSNAFPRNLEMRVAVDMFAVMTNETGKIMLTNPVFRGMQPLQIPANTWRGFTSPNYAATDGSIKVPLPPSTNSFYFLGNVTYSDSKKGFLPLTGTFERNGSRFPYPEWWMNLRARVRFILVDREANRIVDFANLDSTQGPIYLADLLMRDTPDQFGGCDYPYIPNGSDGSMWCTNRQPRSFSDTVPTFGILNQIKVGMDEIQSTSWVKQTNLLGIDFFRYQFDRSPETYPSSSFSKTNVFYCPFSPTRNVHFFISWQANDPLVHYTAADLQNMVKTNLWDFNTRNSSIDNIGKLNTRYEPWSYTLSGSSSPNKYNISVKDPLVTRSDDWDFPTNKMPNVGWIGRIHRGTPWQTIYLKSAVADPKLWMQWAGSGLMITNYGQVDTNLVKYLDVIDDTAFSRPTNDWHIVDLFTAAINQNATRGQLSVNQTNLAAWSAVLAGVNVLPDLRSNVFIQPAGVYDPTNPAPLVRIVNGINDVRRTNYAGGSFRRLGDILSVPELTVKSPYLSGYTNLCNDAVYERIPQQILGLLRCEDAPRFVIYSYGQALKPANKSVLMGGAYAGLCTNYQVTAEVATRSVVRIEDASTKPHIVVESYTQLPPDQ